MKFLLTYRQDPAAPPPTPEKMAEIAAYSEENVRKGIVVLTGGIVRAGKGTQVKQANAKFSFTDGPFAETKELIDGFAIVEAASPAAALDIARDFMRVAGDGEGEILAIFEGPADPH